MKENHDKAIDAWKVWADKLGKKHNHGREREYRLDCIVQAHGQTW